MKSSTSLESELSLRERLAQLGQDLQEGFREVLEALPTEARRTSRLSGLAGVNKVFASRLLTAMKQTDPLAVVDRMPGPEPLRNFLARLGEGQVPRRSLLAARQAVESFDRVISREAGSRSALQTMMSSWVGEAQGEFHSRRRQTAFKAVSELKGAAVDLSLSLAILHPSADPERLDLVWVMHQIGLQRLRPDAPIRLDTRRLSDEGDRRHPEALSGAALEEVLPGDLRAFCPNGPAPIEARQVDGTMNYMLAGEAFGPHQRCDMLLVEINRAEMRRRREDQPGRRSYLYANPVPPARTLVLDVLLHRSLLGPEAPELLVYDTAGSGPKDPNDPLSAFDLLESTEELEHIDLAEGDADLPEYSRYSLLLEAVMLHLDWKPEDFGLWRARLPFPLHSSQVTVAFQPAP